MPASPADGVCAPAVGPAMIAMIASDGAVNPRTLMEDISSFGAVELHRLAQQPAVQPRTTRVVAQSTLAEPAYGERVDTVFLGLYARRQARLVIVRRHGNARLGDPRAAVATFRCAMQF